MKQLEDILKIKRNDIYNLLSPKVINHLRELFSKAKNNDL